MKKTQTLVLLSSLIASTAAFSASGAAPQCSKGDTNIEIYNKDLASEDCSSATGKGEYCIFDTYLVDDGSGPGETCRDGDNATITQNSNESYSFGKKRSVKIRHYLYHKGNRQIAKLRFNYSHGVLSNNCSEVFGSDVQCITTKSGSPRHPLYLVTIRKVS